MEVYFLGVSDQMTLFGHFLARRLKRGVCQNSFDLREATNPASKKSVSKLRISEFVPQHKECDSNKE